MQPQLQPRSIIYTQNSIALIQRNMLILVLGLPAHDAVFIFFASLTGLFKSSVINIFQNAIFISNKFGNVLSSFFHMQKYWVLHIFILECRLEQIFIFVFKLNLTFSNLPENPQGAPVFYSWCANVNNKMIWSGLYPDAMIDRIPSL